MYIHIGTYCRFVDNIYIYNIQWLWCLCIEIDNYSSCIIYVMRGLWIDGWVEHTCICDIHITIYYVMTVHPVARIWWSAHPSTGCPVHAKIVLRMVFFLYTGWVTGLKCHYFLEGWQNQPGVTVCNSISYVVTCHGVFI